MSEEKLHAAGTGPTLGRAYCGSKTKNTTTDWTRVGCINCAAAHRADQAAGITS